MKSLGLLVTLLTLLFMVGISQRPNKQARKGCDSSYPDVCIPSPPRDLDCGDIPYRRFKVVGNDPHSFDGDQDGIGCEG